MKTKPLTKKVSPSYNGIDCYFSLYITPNKCLFYIIKIYNINIFKYMKYIINKCF